MRILLLFPLLLFSVVAPAQQAEPLVAIQAITFQGASQLDASEQQVLANQLHKQTYRGRHWLDEVNKRIADLWQQHGYFQVMVDATPTVLAKAGNSEVVVVTAKVQEGRQYRLQQLRWQNATAFSANELDALMPLKPGDIFNTEKVRQGFEALRQAYFSKGYTRMTAVPLPEVDRQNGTVTLTVDIREDMNR